MRVPRMDAGEADTRHAAVRALHAEAEERRTVRASHQTVRSSKFGVVTVMPSIERLKRRLWFRPSPLLPARSACRGSTGTPPRLCSSSRSMCSTSRRLQPTKAASEAAPLEQPRRPLQRPWCTTTR